MYNKKSLSYAGVFLSLIGICSAIYYRMNMTGFAILDSAVNSMGGFFPLLFVVVGVAFLILGEGRPSIDDVVEDDSDDSTSSVLSFGRKGDTYVIHDDRNELGKGTEMRLPVFAKGFEELGNEEKEIVRGIYAPLLTEAVGRGGKMGRGALEFLRVVDPKGAREYEQKFRDEDNEQTSRGEDKSGGSNRLSNLGRKRLRDLYIGFKGGNVGGIADELRKYGFTQENNKANNYRFSDRRGTFIDIPLGGIADDRTKRLNYASTAIGKIEESIEKKRDKIRV